MGIPKPDRKANRKPTHKAVTLAATLAATSAATSAATLAAALAVAGTLEPKGRAVASHTSAVAVDASTSTSAKPVLAAAECRVHLPRWAHQWPYQGLPQLLCLPFRSLAVGSSATRLTEEP